MGHQCQRGADNKYDLTPDQLGKTIARPYEEAQAGFGKKESKLSPPSFGGTQGQVRYTVIEQHSLLTNTFLQVLGQFHY